jgi:pimeloyl-ACP methyl ester carboxylesterase
VIRFQLPGDDIRPNARNWAQAGTTGSPLLLFLPATRSIPRHYELFLSCAASLGFTVLALDYANRGPSLAAMCAGLPDCYEAVQLNRFDGTAPNRWSAVDETNAILGRLVRALAELSELDPEGGWENWLRAGEPRWDRVVVAGHSQGGGQAAFIGKRHPLLGTIMFSAPAQTDAGVSAPWLSVPGRTPPSRSFGFVSAHDGYFESVVNSWKALGLATPVDVESGLRSGAHAVVSDFPLGTAAEAHRRSISDSTPLDHTGSPVFEPVWRYLLDAVWHREDS